jgi:hypothetical protein
MLSEEKLNINISSREKQEVCVRIWDILFFFIVGNFSVLFY